MPYFIVLPLYSVALVVAMLAGLVCLFIPNARPFSAYFFAAAFGSIPGIVVANVALFLILAPIVKGTIIVPESLHWLTGLFVGAGLLIGPFVVSGAGVLIGASLGCAIVRRFRHRASSSVQRV